MAEPLALIGLAGNIIQFISFSSTLVSKSREIYHSASGVLSENVDLQIISMDLRELNGQIQGAGSSHRFSDIVSRCDLVARDLLEAIGKLTLKHEAQRSRRGLSKWQSFRKALKSVWEKERVNELRARLNGLREQVTMHLVHNTSENQTHLCGLLETWADKNEKTGYKITEQIQALDVQLQKVQKQVSRVHDDDYWRQLRDHFSQISFKVQRVAKCHTIIRSLRYEYMEVRQHAIKIAHKQTFDWIFDRPDRRRPDRCSNIGFTDWLRNGSGIYWVTGKPGSGKSTLMKYLYDHQEMQDHLLVWSSLHNARLVKASFYFWNPGQEMQKSLEGLLQALLYYVIHGCPDLVPILCNGRWNSEQPDALDSPWSITELQEAFAALRAQSSSNTNFYFHVDGLDECGGDHWEVIEVLKELSACPNVKLCLSSRPWNCFQDAFGRAKPLVLQLHEWTRNDIELFARENLTSYTHDTDFEPSLFNDLIRDIGDRAQGVFLWDDTTFGLHLPSQVWREHQIQKRVIQTQRRLNGRFKGLLEPSSIIDIGPQPTLDFLHRTLRDFLATGRMKRQLQSWAASEMNVFTAMSRAFIAASKFIEERPSAAGLISAVELGHRGAVGTGDTANYFEILDQVELACERFEPKRPSRNLMCLEIAVWTGHTEYIRHRLRKDSATLDLDRILKHAVQYAQNSGATFVSSLCLSLHDCATSRNHCPRPPPPPRATGNANNVASSAGLRLLLHHGADLNKLVDGSSSWITFLGEVIWLMDSEQKEHCWNVFELFLERKPNLNIQTSVWHRMLHRTEGAREVSLITTLKYFKRLFIHGLNPNISTQGATITTSLLRFISAESHNTVGAASVVQNELLREFFRFGADVSQIYRDSSTTGWLNHVSQGLVECSQKIPLLLKISELQIFLEHGLDPNATLRGGGTTVWEYLLDAIYSGLRGKQPSSGYQQYISQMMLLSLKYGANPHTSGLQAILEWMKGGSGRLQPAEIWEIERTVQKEIEQATPQVHPYTPSYACTIRPTHATSHRRIDTAAAHPQGYRGTDAGTELSQDRKRKAAHMPHLNYGTHAKRGRFGR